MDSPQHLVAQVSDWVVHHEALTAVLAVASIVVSVGGLLLIPWAIVRIPPDYFAHQRPPEWGFGGRHPVVRVALIVLKNLLGLLLLVGGIIMSLPLVPGPGLLCMLLGMILIDIPGKRQMERWIVRRPRVLAGLNLLRAKWNRPPLESPD